MYRGSWRLSSAPATEPITPEDLQTQLRIDSDAEYDYLGLIITAAREHLEQICRRALITQTWTLTLEDWGAEIILPRPPLVSVTSIAYLDTSGDSQTLAADQYRVLTKETPGRIVPEYAIVWPTLYDVENAVTVTYVAGYGAATAVPSPIKHALKLIAAHWYEQREPVAFGITATQVPMTVDALIAPYRVWG